MTRKHTLSLQRRMLVILVCLITFVMPLGVWLASAGNPLAYFSAAVPPGQTFYVFSKLFGLLAIVMLWFQGMAALAKNAPVLRGFPRLSRRAHVALGVASVTAVVLHVSWFVIASSIRTQHVALDLLLPTFSHGHYRMMVGVGAIAFWLLALALLGGWRRLKGSQGARWLHRLVLGAMCAGFVHGMTVGSETRFGLMTYVYAFIGLSLGTALTSWTWHALRRPRRAIAEGPTVLAASAIPGDEAR